MPTKTEIEVKIRVDSVESTRQQLLERGAVVEQERTLERNWVFDSPDLQLRQSGWLFRLREVKGEGVLTLKFPVASSDLPAMKVRGELETPLDDLDELAHVLQLLGFQVVFQYEKYRELLRDGEIEISLDETPMGVFLELEGPPKDIRSWADGAGHDEADFLSQTYAELYRQYAEEAGLPPEKMTFREGV